MSEDKRYMATLLLGIETDTLDSTGRITRTRHVPALSGGYIREKTRGFVGDIRQVPPMYSAVKYRGVRAYQLARKGLQMALPSRTVTVSSFRIVSVQLPRVTLEVCCSGGTYIRSLAADFGKRLGPGGHLTALRRLASGPFRVEDALNSKEISQERGASLMEQKMIPMREALPGRTEVAVGDLLAGKIRQGYQPAWGEMAPRDILADPGDRHIKVVCRGELVAILSISGNREASGGQMKIERVFPGQVGLNENS
jgi:tRNA pseudouridine55 synthase